jgi:phospholipid-binding lipoprotein MlaA
MKKTYFIVLVLLFSSSLAFGMDNNTTIIDNQIEREIDSELEDETNSSLENGFTDESFDEFGGGFSDEFTDELETYSEKDFDPLSGYNRLMTGFNDSVYTYLIFPLGRGYNYITPTQFRVSVGNFFNNLQYPVRVTNNLFQLKFANSVEETGRFLVNSTIGLLGLFDPAQAWFGWEAHKEDFGQTLGYYGVGGGFHLVLPFLGPSNLRDTTSLALDWYIDPFFYQEGRSYNLITENVWQSIGLKSFDYFNKNSANIDAYETLKKDAIDLYPLLKNVYEQKREQEIQE